MREIGKVKFVQIQPSRLKLGQKPNRYYDPSALLVVERIRISPEGVIGITPDDTSIKDIHHSQHPETRNVDGMNGVSLGFTSHYQIMRNKFGAHLIDGCAGENVLIESDLLFMLEDLEPYVVIRSSFNGDFITLTNLVVAAPCVEFSHYAANAGASLPAAEIQATLKFLHNGTRGFYATSLNAGNSVVQAGDTVFVTDTIPDSKE